MTFEYPKINSLYKREGHDYNPETHEPKKSSKKAALIIGEYACEEFEAIKRWTITEKVDGTNVRIIFERPALDPSVCKIHFKGRTDNAQFPTFLLTYLQDTFTIDKMDKVFEKSNYVILFGEGYGPKIQSGGYYRKDPSFILFDAYISGWWLNRDGVSEIANQLDIDHVPIIGNIKLNNYCGGIEQTRFWTTQEIEQYVRSKPKSNLAQVEEREMEGIVARSEPQMMFRKGGPIMFKLKCKDF